MERLLSILECFAEDELYLEHEIDIEHIEKLISRDHSMSLLSQANLRDSNGTIS